MQNKKMFLEEMAPDSRKVLEDLVWDKASSVRFFSYGSNMNERKFKKDMKGKIGLINITATTLADFKRILSNKSRHGVAFSICCSPEDKVEGICHDVPIESLEDFLKKEGVLKKNDPNYRLIRVSIPNQKEPVLTLCGLKPTSVDKLSLEKAKETLDYVEKSIAGARSCKIDHSDMTEMKKKLYKLIKNKEMQTKIKNLRLGSCLDVHREILQ